MNSILGIGPLSGTLVSDDEQTVISAQEIKFEKEAGPIRDSMRLRSIRRFEELLEGILAFLTVGYLMGAIGFGGLLLFYNLHR